MLGTTKEKTGHSFQTRSEEGIVECDVALTEKLDLLFEKRHTIREAALNTINTTLSMRVCGPCIESRQEILAGALQHILQRADVSETLLALRCVCLASLALYEGAPFKQKMEIVLTKIISDETRAVDDAVRAAAVDALALVCFMNSSDSKHVMEISYTISSIFYEDAVPASILRAALDGWTLLLTVIDDGDVQNSLFPENIDKLNEFLDHSDHDVRVSSGKAIALCVESLRNNLKQETPDYQVLRLSNIAAPVDWEDIMSKLDYLSSEKLKAQSKKEGKEQKKMFRQLITAMESGEAPHQSISIRDVHLVLDSWAKVTQLDRIRGYLGEGFILQMANNNNMMQIFDYYVNPDPTESAQPQFTKKERRRSMIEAEKSYTKYMGASRRPREFERAMGGFASE
jgi:hypothetical protein